MWHIRLFITQITSALHVQNEISKDKSIGCGRSISFTLTPSYSEPLKLKTGQIFQHKKLAQKTKTQNHQISAQLIVRENLVDLNTDEVREDNSLEYNDSGLTFVNHLAGREFESLYSSILAGHSPKSVDMIFSERIKFSRNTDESVRTWDNEDQKRVPLKSIGFHFEHVGEEEEEQDFLTYRFLGDMPVHLETKRSAYSD